jgi:hypothetical protein
MHIEKSDVTSVYPLEKPSKEVDAEGDQADCHPDKEKLTN